MKTKWIIILLLLITNQIFGQNKCIGEHISFWVDSNTTWEYKWFIEPDLPFNGQSSSSISIDSLPEFLDIYVEVTNHYGCVGEAYLSLNAEDCGWSIYFPNAIILSGVNTTWFPKFTNVIIKELTIWDRWGHVQWQWNGNGEFLGFNDKGSQLDGVFTYLCVYSPNSKSVEYRKIGRVTVIH